MGIIKIFIFMVVGFCPVLGFAAKPTWFHSNLRSRSGVNFSVVFTLQDVPPVGGGSSAWSKYASQIYIRAVLSNEGNRPEKITAQLHGRTSGGSDVDQYIELRPLSAQVYQGTVPLDLLIQHSSSGQSFQFSQWIELELDYGDGTYFTLFDPISYTHRFTFNLFQAYLAQRSARSCVDLLQES